MPNLAIVKPQPGDEVTSAWGTSVADGMNGIQTGVATLALSAVPSVTTTITFPRAFASPPVVVASAYSSGISGTPIVFMGTPSATGVLLGIIPNAGGNLPASGSCPVSWVAIGVPA